MMLTIQIQTRSMFRNRTNLTTFQILTQILTTFHWMMTFQTKFRKMSVTKTYPMYLTNPEKTALTTFAKMRNSIRWKMPNWLNCSIPTN